MNRNEFLNTIGELFRNRTYKIGDKVYYFDDVSTTNLTAAEEWQAQKTENVEIEGETENASE